MTKVRRCDQLCMAPQDVLQTTQVDYIIGKVWGREKTKEALQDSGKNKGHHDFAHKKRL